MYEKVDYNYVGENGSQTSLGDRGRYRRSRQAVNLKEA